MPLRWVSTPTQGVMTFASSAPVTTAMTPGAFFAAAVAIAVMRACACGERTKATCAMRGSVTSLTILGAASRQPREIGPRHRAADIGVRPVERGESGRRVVGDFHRVPCDMRAPARRLRPHRRSPDSRCSGSSCRRDARGFVRGSARRRRASSSCAVSSMPGVQKPHCSALRAMNASCRSAISSVSDTPSMVSTLRAVALHREHQAAAHDRAVDPHRAGAADAVLAADMAAGQRQHRRAGNRPASCARRRSRGSPRRSRSW